METSGPSSSAEKEETYSTGGKDKDHHSDKVSGSLSLIEAENSSKAGFFNCVLFFVVFAKNIVQAHIRA